MELAVLLTQDVRLDHDQHPLYKVISKVLYARRTILICGL